MKQNSILLAIVATLCVATSTYSAETSNHAPPTASAPTAWVNPGWSVEESVIAAALAIRAQELEKGTGTAFGNKWKPKVSVEWSVGRNIDGKYEPETQTIYFAARLMSELNIRYKTPLRLLDPTVLAKDETFGKLVDHELGHALSDEVSRKAGAGPFFTTEHFNMLTHEEQLGLNIVSEGIGEFFGHARHPTDEKLSAKAFPATQEEEGLYAYEMIAFQGGYWLANDVLKTYGERGLVWLVTHPFVAREGTMREAATAYRAKALEELGCH